MADVPLFRGGIIPDDDVAEMKAAGVSAVFGPGSSIDEISAFILGKIGTGDRG